MLIRELLPRLSPRNRISRPTFHRCARENNSVFHSRQFAANSPFSFCIDQVHLRQMFCLSPCLRGEIQCWEFPSPDHARSPDLPTTLLSSMTSSGHSGQLCTQHTIRSHASGSCRCRLKL